jgi:hypothetical protein
LLDLKAQVEAEQAEVAHPKSLGHLSLEAMHLVGVGSRHDQIVEINTKEESRAAPAPCKHIVFRSAACEAKGAKGGIKLRVPRTRNLTEAMKMQNLMVF